MFRALFLFSALLSEFDDLEQFLPEKFFYESYLGEALVGSTERASFLLANDPHIPALDLSDQWKLLLKNYVNEGDLVLDYGAHVGDFSLFLSRLVGIDGKVVAVETDLFLFRGLFWNLVRAHRKNVEIFSMDLHKSIDELDLQGVSLIRIDASGREDLFLKGAEKTLQKYKPTLLVRFLGEINKEKGDRYIQEEFDRRLEKLHDLGYETQQIMGSWYLATHRE